MPDGYMQVDFGVLQDTQDQLSLLYKQALDAVDGLQTRLENELSDWTGQSNGAYQVAKANWNAAFADMASMLNGASVHIGNANAAYMDAERRNTTYWEV